MIRNTTLFRKGLVFDSSVSNDRGSLVMKKVVTGEDRPLPEWLLKAEKKNSKGVTPKPVERRRKIDHQNVPVSWKSPAAVDEEERRAAARRQAKEEQPRPFPRPIRPANVPIDSPVAQFAIARGTRKKFLAPREIAEGPAPAPIEEEPEPQPKEDEDARVLRLDQSKLPMEIFDSLDFIEKDHDPEAWLTEDEVHGFAAYYDAHGPEAIWRWRKCTVLRYDSEVKKYEVKFGAVRTKMVSRLNLRFAKEDEDQWKQRRDAAQKERDKAKATLRFDYFIAEQPASEVRPVQQATLRRIHSRVHDGLLSVDAKTSYETSDYFLLRREAVADPSSKAAMRLKELTADAIRGYARAMKRSVVRWNYNTDKDGFRDEYKRLKLPSSAVAPSPKAPQFGKVTMPSHPYADRRSAVASAHTSAHKQVLRPFVWLCATWEQYMAKQRFVLVPDPRHALDRPADKARNTIRDLALHRHAALGKKLGLLQKEKHSCATTCWSDVSPSAAMAKYASSLLTGGGGNYRDARPGGFPFALPCDLSEFDDAQAARCREMATTLRHEWRTAFAEQVVDNVHDVYDFFLSNLTAYDAGPLKRLLTHLELRMRNQLRELLLASLDDWVTFVRRFCLTSESVVGMATPPLFHVKLKVDDASVVDMEPSAFEIEAALIASVDRPSAALTELTAIDADLMSLLHLPKRKLFDVASSDARERYPLIADCAERVDKARSDVKEMLTKALEGPRNLAAKYQQFVWIADVDTPSHVRTFVRQDPPPTLDEYVAEVRRFHDAAAAIAVLSEDEEKFPLCAVDTTRAKAALGSKAQEVLRALLQHVVYDVRSENEKTIERYEEILARLAEQPTNEAELAALKSFIAETKKEVLDTVDKVARMRFRIQTFDEFCMPLSKDDAFLAWSTMEYPARIHEASNDTEMRIELDKVRMMDKLAMEKNQFEEKLQQFDVDVKKAKAYGDYAKEQAYVEEINRLQDAITEAKATAKDFNEREQVFGFPPTEYAELRAVEDALLPFWDLWNMISDFHTNRHEWLHGAFLDLDGTKIQREVEVWWKQSYKLKSALDEKTPDAASCAAKLREETTTFRENLPLIQALASPALKERHWSKLSEKIGHRITPYDDNGVELTLQGLLDMNTNAYIEEIQEVCVAAEKEYKLERDLQAMKDEWAQVQYDVKPYKETGTFIVGGIDDIITLLDDHVVKTQTMCGSVFIKAIEEDARAWEAQLKYAQVLLDEWIACQRVWMYLEPIFSSEDIMRQLPTEARRFNDVDKLWRATMKATEEDPIFIAQADPQKKLKRKFQEANEKLDKIQKGLSDYLEIKRCYFPRFFFLADDQMLEILSQTKEPRAVQPHLGKAFEGINSVKFETDLKITEMISAESEHVALNNPVDPESPANKGNSERWLLELESVQWESVRRQVELALEAYPRTSRPEWTLQWPAQAVLAVSQIFWTRDVFNTIEQGGSKALSSFVETLNDQLTAIVMLVRGQLSKLERKTLSALVVMDVHARDTIVSMAANKVERTTDFDWISQLRYYWQPAWKDGQAVKKGDNTCVARIVNAKCLYGYEYLGNSMRLVITPLTDRYVLPSNSYV